jgi:hypothetical protein
MLRTPVSSSPVAGSVPELHAAHGRRVELDVHEVRGAFADVGDVDEDLELLVEAQPFDGTVNVMSKNGLRTSTPPLALPFTFTGPTAAPRGWPRCSKLMV